MFWASISICCIVPYLFNINEIPQIYETALFFVFNKKPIARFRSRYLIQNFEIFEKTELIELFPFNLPFIELYI